MSFDFVVDWRGGGVIWPRSAGYLFGALSQTVSSGPLHLLGELKYSKKLQVPRQSVVTKFRNIIPYKFSDLLDIKRFLKFAIGFCAIDKQLDRVP